MMKLKAWYDTHGNVALSTLIHCCLPSPSLPLAADSTVLLSWMASLCGSQTSRKVSLCESSSWLEGMPLRSVGDVMGFNVCTSSMERVLCQTDTELLMCEPFLLVGVSQSVQNVTVHNSHVQQKKMPVSTI